MSAALPQLDRLEAALRDVEVVASTVTPYALPFAHGVRGHTHRHGVLLGLMDRAGRVGWGEAAPWPPTESAARALHGSLTAVTAEPGTLASARYRVPVEARAAIELALLDLSAQASGQPLAILLGGRAALPTLSVSALVADVQEARAQVEAGFRTLKVKLAADDLDLLARIRASIGPEIRLRVDGNQQFTLADLSRATPALQRAGVELFEEPTRPEEGLPDSPNPAIFLDESVRNVADLEIRLATSRPAGVVVKPALSGYLEALRLAAFASSRGLGVVVTHALDSAIGRAGAAHLAAALGARPYADGLSNPAWIGPDVAKGLPLSRGTLTLTGTIGLGVSPAEPVASSPPGPTDLPHPVRSARLGRPTHLAIVAPDEGQTLTWAELDRRVGSRALVFERLGIRPHQVVAVPSAPLVQTIVNIHALTRIGAVAAPLGADRIGLAARIGATAVLDGDGADLATLRVGELPDLGEANERFAGVNDDAYLILTSGTTGSPVPIRLGALQVALSAFGSAMRLGHDPADRWLLCLPLHHVGGLMALIRCAYGAITTVLHGRFDPARVAAALDDGSVTVASFVPAQLERVLDARPDRPFPTSLRVLLVGGAPMSSALRQRLVRLNAPVSASWGMTETASQIATRSPGDLDGAAAPVVPFGRVHTSIEGRAVVTGPIARGTVVTRDLCEIDGRGWVRILGRADDTILSGGLNIDPAEIEAVLRSHPGVEQVAVVGVPHPLWGQRPAAVYVGDATPESLREHCAERLPRPRVPDTFHAVPGLPLSDLGKVRRAEVARSLLTLEATPPVPSQPENHDD